MCLSDKRATIVTSRFKKIYRSVFTKLLVIIFITGFCINLLVLTYFHTMAGTGTRDQFLKNVVQYANYLINDMGDPPDYALAKEISRNSFFEVRYQSPELNWSTAVFEDPDRPAWTRTLYEDDTTRIERYKGRFFIIVDKGHGRFVFTATSGFGSDPWRYDRTALLLALLSVLLLSAYMIIRRLLKPIKLLSEGVKQVGSGNLEYTVSGKGSDEFAELAGAFNDMTERIRAMLHARERLMLDVSHELRTPLTRIKLALEFLPDGDSRNNISEDLLEMEKMIAEILESARMRNTGGQLDKQQINIVALIEETVRLFEHQSPGIEAIDMPARVVLSADPELVKTVLKNLLTNALKYSDEIGPAVTIEVKRRDNMVIVVIKDKGMGIPEEELPYVFEPFYRVDKSRSKRSGGYGLGLSLCKTIIDAHGGKIEIESGTGKGTIVSLVFPG